jgi:hypothetical protein
MEDLNAPISTRFYRLRLFLPYRFPLRLARYP